VCTKLNEGKVRAFLRARARAGGFAVDNEFHERFRSLGTNTDGGDSNR